MVLCVVSLPNTTYTLQLNGQDEVPIGMSLTIQCMIKESGNIIENSGVDLCLVLPTTEVITKRKFITVATLEHSGTYSCIALYNNTSTVIGLQVVVYGMYIKCITLLW